MPCIIQSYSCFHSPAESLTKVLAVALISHVRKGPCLSRSYWQSECAMPPYISNDLKGCIPALQGYSIKKICQLLNVKKTLAYETLKLHQKFGVPYNPHAHQRGVRPRCLATTDLSFIHALLDQQHTVYLDEIQEQLLSCHGVKVSISTLMCTYISQIRTFRARPSNAMIMIA